MAEPSASSAACPVIAWAVASSPVLTASRTASLSRSSISPEVVRVGVERGGQHGQRVGQGAGLLPVERLGQQQRRDRQVPGPLRVLLGGGQVAAGRLGLVAVEADHGRDAAFAADGAGLLQVLRHGRDLGQRLVPAAHLAERLAERAVRLRQPHRRAHLVRLQPGLLGGGQRLVVAVEVAQRDRLVDQQQDAEVAQRRVGLGHRQGAVVERQRVRQVTADDRHGGQHVQRPAGRPGVAGLLGGGERLVRLPAGRLDVAEVEVGARGQHEQAAAVLGGDAGRVERLAQGGERLVGLVRQHPALGQRPVQVDQQVGIGGVAERPLGDPLRLGPVAGPVERVGEPAGQPPVLDRAGRDARHRLAEQFRRDPRRLADQGVGRGG